MELKNVVPWGRSFDEYQEIFSLTNVDLNKSILGCGDGPASFNAELTKRGGNVVSVDPTYEFTAEELQSRIAQVCDEIIPQMIINKDKYVWESIPSVEALGKIRMKAMNEFIADFDAGKLSGRYFHESLPSLSFEGKQFELALCSHYLFLYSEHVNLEQHIASIKELCRVAKEVRIYPLLSLDGEISPHLNEVISSLDAVGLTNSLVDVGYQFQKGATQMLVVKSV
ncbi:SAM-dependent methyltransferase [Motilimonas pumila]|uniref:SAM-dependent methyltransferase n=1 Tax=Motilimonas pumila TaxID=2303987 RepID=A0A418Y9E3_9GAMM|nr:SAM-dependent methyltransferase [Motilimonas pumila]RJG37022.1 SAM-dependent methyltransferase [Motilimonas pumila]